MAMMAANAVLVDTNILVCAQQAFSPFHQAATLHLQQLSTAGQSLWISRQILREYLAAMSRPGGLTTPVPLAALVTDVRSFQQSFSVAEDGPSIMDELLALLGAVPCAGKQVHDANIVATMLAHSIPNLLTHNVTDFVRFAGYITIVPLVT